MTNREIACDIYIRTDSVEALLAAIEAALNEKDVEIVRLREQLDIVLEGYKVLAGMGGVQDPMKVLEAVSGEIARLKEEVERLKEMDRDHS